MRQETISDTYMHRFLPTWQAGLAVAATLLGVSCTKAQFAVFGDAATDPVAGDAPKPDLPQIADAKIGADDGKSVSDARGSDARSDTTGGCSAPTVERCLASGEGDCDPVCQTNRGCDYCQQKCSYRSTDMFATSSPVCEYLGKQGGLLDACDVTDRGTARETDGCGSGLICMAPTAGELATYCFQLCRDQVDCTGGTACGPRKLEGGTSVSVCDPPYDQCSDVGGCCDPLAIPPAANGCPAGRVCLLVGADPSGRSRTVCEFTYGDGRGGAPCKLPRDCQQRFTCVENFCREVVKSSTVCPAGTTYQARGKDYGWCK